MGNINCTGFRNTASGIDHAYGASDTPGPSQQGALLSGIVSVGNQPQENLFENLPTEILHKIAFSRNAEDYGNLRATCKDFAERLPDFSAISEELKQGRVQGETGERYRDMLEDKMRDNERKAETLYSVQNCRIEPEARDAHLTSVATEILHNGDEMNIPKPGLIEETISLCASNIKDSLSFQADMIHYLSTEYGMPATCWISFKYSKIHPNTLNAIFAGFDKTIRDIEGPERFVIARLADTLRNQWIENPPGSVNRDNIAALPAAYPELFKAADRAAIMIVNSTERA